MKKNSVTKLCIRKMKTTDSYKRVSKLIYDTDDFLYPDLLGHDRENACKVLSELLDDPKSLFFYKNYYVAEYEGKIVGIAALHKGQIKWRPKRIKRVFQKLGIDVPDTFKHVSKYYKDIYGNDQSGNLKIRNFAVKPKCRKHDVGSRLMRQIIDENGDAPIELWVLTSNRAAIQLYVENGFVKDGQDILDYGGYIERRVMSRKMIRH